MPERPTKQVYLLADESDRPEDKKAFRVASAIIDSAARTDKNIIPIHLDQYNNDYEVAEAIKQQTGTENYSVFILEHGAYLGRFGERFDYKGLFTNLSDNVVSVNVLNCHSSSALSVSNALPNGAIVYPSVERESLDYGSHTSEKLATAEFTAEYSFLKELSDNFYLYAQNNASNSAPKSQPPYPTDPDKIIPHEFAISGYGTIDLEEQIKGLQGKKLPAPVIDTVNTAFEHSQMPLIFKGQVQYVADKIEHGEPLNHWQDKAIAYALTYVELDRSGQIGQWRQEAVDRQQKLMATYDTKLEAYKKSIVSQGLTPEEADEFIATYLPPSTSCIDQQMHQMVTCTRTEGALSKLNEAETGVASDYVSWISAGKTALTTMHPQEIANLRKALIKPGQSPLEELLDIGDQITDMPPEILNYVLQHGELPPENNIPTPVTGGDDITTGQVSPLSSLPSTSALPHPAPARK